MFNIGDKVICIDASMLPHTVEELKKDMPNWVKEGNTYTIRGFADHDFVVGIYLEEVVNSPKWFKLVNKFIEPAFKCSRFRKLESPIEQKQEIEQLEELLL